MAFGDDQAVMERRGFLRAAGGAGLLALGGCATARPVPVPVSAAAPHPLPFYDRLPHLAPIRPHPDRIFNITVCSRPFRAAGPRLDAETIGGKLVVHNYGHGGSGWSLSWGSGVVAVRKALAGGARDIAVIGCGALGLTAALVAQRAGAKVTIYARDRLSETRSARATGTWSPDSRIALAEGAGPDFPALWEEMARTSWRMHSAFLGAPGAPVEWYDRYFLSDYTQEEQAARRAAAPPYAGPHFAQYQGRVPDLGPRNQTLPPGSHPFPLPRVSRTSLMMFNITEYGRVLEADFRLAGGTIVTRTFASPAEFVALKEPVVINCTGYGARALMKDESVIPVRGQIAWLIPQPDVNYGLQYRNVSLLGRRDGIVIQQVGADESWGYNIPDETPDRA